MAFHSRRGVNVSDFVNQLNSIPSAQDLQSTEDFNLDDDLAMFTNAQFFDFDLGHDTGLHQSPPSEFDAGRGQSTVAPDTVEMKSMDFNGLQGDFSFPDFNAFAQTPAATFGSEALPHTLPVTQTTQPYAAGSSGETSPSNTTSPDLKRKASSPAIESYEEASRLAAEEDKRRRNTAASARFRVKKKQREQALEQSAKEMSDKVSALEGRISQLETENKWLKNLITEKNETKEDIAALWRKYSQETAERKVAERKDGVGTKAAAKSVKA